MINSSGYFGQHLRHLTLHLFDTSLAATLYQSNCSPDGPKSCTHLVQRMATNGTGGPYDNASVDTLEGQSRLQTMTQGMWPFYKTNVFFAPLWPNPAHQQPVMTHPEPHIKVVQTQARSIFIGALPYSASDSDLEWLLRQAGHVLKYEVKRDETGKSRKTSATARYSTIQEAQKAIKMIDGCLFQGWRLSAREDRDTEPIANGSHAQTVKSSKDAQPMVVNGSYSLPSRTVKH